MMNKILILYMGISLLTNLTSANAQAQKSAYRIANTINLTGDGWWDYLTVDEVNQKLFISHGNQVNVVDLKANQQVTVIQPTDGVHGIAIANDLNRAFISCGMDSSVLVVELNGFKPVKQVKVTGKNPDAILYDPFSKKVFTFNGGSSNATVIDASGLNVIATIWLAGKPEFSQSDGKGKIFVNIEDKSSIAVINAVSLKIENLWAIAPGEEPSGLALDNENHRLFSVCGNKLMTVTDAVTGKVITTVAIGDGCDGVTYDVANKCIFTSNGEGTMTVIQQVSADEYKVLENFATLPGARTITMAKTSHHIYLPAGEYMPGTGRRPVKPNTFRVIDIEPVR
jgi:DNA-binding beta-propeller fold protein YncE